MSEDLREIEDAASQIEVQQRYWEVAEDAYPHERRSPFGVHRALSYRYAACANLRQKLAQTVVNRRTLFRNSCNLRQDRWLARLWHLWFATAIGIPGIAIVAWTVSPTRIVILLAELPRQHPLPARPHGLPVGQRTRRPSQPPSSRPPQWSAFL